MPGCTRASALCLTALSCGPGAPESGARCPAASVAISEIQGTGAASPLLGQQVAVTGSVSVARASVGSQPGFFLQSDPSDGAPSAGIFIAERGAVAAGERLYVSGRVEELGGVTALGELELVQPCGRAALRPTELELGSALDAERSEGLWLRSPQTWTLLDTSELWSGGRVSVSPRGRAYAPGHPLGGEPAELWTLLGLEETARGWLEAGALSEHLRLGAQARGLSAVVLSGTPPTLLASEPVAFRAAPAPALEPRAGALRVAALNLDNYFVDLGARGADSERELGRQRDKLVAALLALDADILALNELENPPPVTAAPAAAAPPPSAADLIAALDARLPRQLAYVLSESPAPSGAIRSAIAYRASSVRALGSAWLESAPAFRRAPSFQTFEARGRQLTVGVVHLKSKLCEGAAQVVGAEGCGAETRREEARALGAIVTALPEARARDLLLIGDFNSDSGEAPLAELQRAGLIDLFAGVPAAERYSYVFGGRATQLDHALGGPALAAALARAQIWHIDADEPALLDYQLDNPPEAYRPDARRCSDHDPILVDFAL